MGDVAYVGSATNGASSGTAISCTHGLTIAAGDVIIIAINYNGGAYTVDDNNGSTPCTSILANRSYNGGSASYHLWYRVAGASEPSAYAFTGSNSERWSIIVAQYRGVNATIWDVQPTSSTEKLTEHTTIPTNALTTLTNGAMVLAFAFGDSATATFSATPADSFTSRQNNSGEELIALADKAMPTAGLQSAVSWTASGWGQYATQIFSLKPVVAQIAKIDGIATSSLAKYNGIAKASIAKIMGLEP